MPASVVILDGSHGEGGSALLRTALTMACMTQQPTRVEHVRGGTKFPGLHGEDLALVRMFASAVRAETTGIELGSNTISFFPTVRPRALREQFGVDGSPDVASCSAPVLLQALLPLAAVAGAMTDVTVLGETYGNFVLTYDYFAHVTLAALRRFGLYAYPEMSRAGFGRASVGEVRLEIEPSGLKGVHWEDRGKLLNCRAVVTTAELNEQVGQRGISHLESLAHHAGFSLEAEHQMVKSSQPGAFVTVWAEYENGFGGATKMGSRGVRMESVAQMAFDGFLEWVQSGKTTDSFLCDQILIPACFASGETQFSLDRLTSRMLTQIWVIKQFLPIHLTVLGSEGGPGQISIRR